MKKTLITLLALCGCAMATTTDFLDLSETCTIGNLTYDASTSTITTTNNSDLFGINNAGLQTILTLKINLTEAKKVTEATNIITLDFAADTTIGLVATSSGFSTALNGSTSGRSSVTWDTLESTTNCLTTGSDGDTYIVLSYAHIPAGSFGSTLYNDTATPFFKDTGARRADKSDTLDGIVVNSDLLAAVEVTSTWIDPNSLVTPFITTSANSLTIPEPTTATLSLLALAGLAARRRRK